MSKERQKLFIFEGLSCCGKSSLINSFTTEPGCHLIVRRDIPRDLLNPTPDIFMKNDEAKFAAARDCPGWALMDRGYLSTLVFYTVMEKARPSFSAEGVRNWITRSIGSTIYKPDYYVYVDISPEISRERGRQTGRPFDERNLWMTHTELMQEWYFQYLQILEKDVPLIRLDGTVSLTSLQQELKKFFDKLRQGH